MMEINREKLERVLHAFHRMTGVRIAVIDATYGEIAGYPAESCALCRRLREKKEILDACVYSDRCAFIQACRSGRQYTYRCHMNMYESVYPVVLRGAVAGYVMIGQFIDEQEREAVYRSAREAVGDVPELRREVDALRALRSDEVASLAYLMAVCAEYLCFSEALTAGRSRKLAGVDAYIRENMKGPLSVIVLAQALIVHAGTEIIRNQDMVRDDAAHRIAGDLEFLTVSVEKESGQSGGVVRLVQRMAERDRCSVKNAFFQFFHGGLIAFVVVYVV